MMHVFLGNQKISDASFKQIGKLCPDLRLLYMTDCQKITDISLKHLTGCRNLTVVNLADCVRYGPLILLTFQILVFLYQMTGQLVSATAFLNPHQFVI